MEQASLDKAVRAALSTFKVEAALKQKFDRDRMCDVLKNALSSQVAELSPEANVRGVLECFGQLLRVPSLRLGSLCATELEQLLEVCARLSLPAPRFAVELNVGYGGSPDLVQVRTPAYLVPALEMLAVFHRFYKSNKLRQMPVLRVMNATKIALEVNRGFDAKKTSLHGWARTEVLREFVGRFVPADLRQHVVFVTDEDLPYADGDTAVALLKCALDRDAALAAQYEHMRVTSVRRVGERSLDEGTPGSIDAALQAGVARYITAHPLIFRDLVVGGAPEAVPSATISVGGAAEERFNCFRRDLQALVVSDPLLLPGSDAIRRPQLSVRLVSKIGSNPPYYATDGDVPMWTQRDVGVTLGPVFSGHVDASKRSQIAADYDTLLRYTNGEASYRSFCADMAQWLATLRAPTMRLP